jgi:hypothetical protein
MNQPAQHFFCPKKSFLLKKGFCNAATTLGVKYPLVALDQCIGSDISTKSIKRKT